jgi:hypothetical protein
MSLHPIDPAVAAVARLNALRFDCSISEVAQTLARWQASHGALVVPIAVPLTELKSTEAEARGPQFFRDRAKQMRALIANRLALTGDAAEKLTFSMSSKEAWYLGPRARLDAAAMFNAVASNPAKFIELMLLKEMAESAARGATDTFVGWGFGPGVYLGSLSQASRSRLDVAEVEFRLQQKHGLLLCDVSARTFSRKQSAGAESSATRAAETGEGFMVGVTRIVPGDFIARDARERPLVGVSLDLEKVRRTRLYYLNVVSEFAIGFLTKASVPFRRETFVATHCVDDAYIPLEPLAYLQRPLVVVNATPEPLGTDARRTLQQLPDYLPDYHVAGGKKIPFDPPAVELVDAVPQELSPTCNYLFLNGEGDEGGGTVRLAAAASSEFKPVEPWAAYGALSRGEGTTDPYTRVKFRHLLSQSTVTVACQGLDYGPKALGALPMEKSTDAAIRQVQEALKRCLVELSLKEALLGHKPIAVLALPPGLPSDLTLLATRRMRAGRKAPPEQMIAAVDVNVGTAGIKVRRVRRTPWGDSSTLMDTVSEFPFLQEDGKEGVRDGQFWVIDGKTKERLRVWAGDFVPKIILNDVYEGIEHAIAAQEDHLGARREDGSKGRFLSKSREFNLLPYYISMFKPEHSQRGERAGLKMPVQDCGTWVRLFVPPEGGISGGGDALSGMRDVMHYSGNTLTMAGLLDLPLVQLYLHTMTNGVLVGGDNSKMSVLEKLARLALEN